MNSQFNSTGEFGINRYGPASGPQHIASAPQQGGDGVIGQGEMEQRQKDQEGIMGGQRQNRRSHRNRSHRNRSHRNRSHRNKSQRGGNRSDKRRRSDRTQRGGK